ncbi:GNAT family N-acetyltransferase [Micromonospora zhanjiangensis]|uniref:GNAT family N-acetyltransferase n=1 Tax=Micromonospora zhanjiangensis TaxID=1522057 RepID=A0ABV8KN88_9ACTN
MSLKIRTALPEDSSAVAPLLAELGYPQQVDTLPERIAQLADTPTDAVLVAELDGRVVGVACLHVTVFFHLPGAGRARLTALVVESAYRGAGIGARLLRAAETAAGVRGCSALELTSAAHREAAHRFYRTAGYEDLPHRFIKHLNTG